MTERTASVSARIERHADRATLVAVSGIDGSGKTTFADELEAALVARGDRVAVIHLDPWHTPLDVRFLPPGHAGDRGRHFYERAYRWNDLFAMLVDPLVRDRAIALEAMLIRFPENDLVPTRYDFDRIDVVILEGIFVLRRELRPRYDLAVWIDCSFETALERALARNQEGKPAAELEDDYARIYFPAQRHHFAIDDPRGAADIVI